MEHDPRNQTDRSLKDVVVVAVPEDAQVVRVDVEAGDTVVLPFPDDGSIMMKEGNGNLGIKAHDTTVILQGYADAASDPHNPVIIESAERVPLDVSIVLAMTDPNLDVIACGGWFPQEPGVDTGGIFQFFAGGVTMREIEAVGPISADALVPPQASILA